MTDKIYDNAKLTKLVNKLLIPEKVEKKTVVFPDLLQFPITGYYEMAIPAGTVVGLNAFTKISDEVKDGEKKEYFIDLQFMEGGQLTTKSIPVKAGVTAQKLNIKVLEGFIRFTIPSTEVLYSNITLVYLPFDRMEI